MTIDIDKLTIGEAKQLRKLIDCSSGAKKGKTHSFEIGKAYFIRTVTHYYTGRVVAVTASDLVLDDAAWVADSGRFHETLRDGKLKEVEPMPNGTIVGRGAIVDAAPWAHALPKEAK